MKASRFLILGVLFIVLPLLVISGCKYNVSEPLWDQPYTAPAAPKITSIVPSDSASAGVNIITIKGENLKLGTGTTRVSFNNIYSDVLSISATSIVVLRPNVVSDSTEIKVIPHDAIQEAIYSPYKVTQVVNKYGSFLQNVPLSVIAVANNGNLYVVDSTTQRNIYKATPDGNNTVIAHLSRNALDGKIGPDGNLYLTEKNRAIYKVDVSTNNVSRWTQMPFGKIVSYIDFGSNGYFFTGGSKTDLLITPFNLSAGSTSSGFYASDDIQCIRFFNGYVYVASITSGAQEPSKIWRDKVNSDGTVGARELIFDMNSVHDSAAVSGLAFSQSGNLYISTNSDSDPLLYVNPSTGKAQYMYKGILPRYCAGIAYGSSNYLYLISGNTSASVTWTVYQVNMGQEGAPSY